MRTAVAETLVAATRALNLGVPILWEGVFATEPPELHLRADLLPVDETARNIMATQLHSVAIGIWQLTVVAGTGTAPQGMVALHDLVDQIKDGFRVDVVLPAATSDPTVSVRITRTSDAPAIPGVARRMIPVSIGYRAHRIH